MVGTSGTVVFGDVHMLPSPMTQWSIQVAVSLCGCNRLGNALHTIVVHIVATCNTDFTMTFQASGNVHAYTI